MSINLIVNKKSEKSDKLDARKLHYMPCKINFDGPANFSKYFVVQEEKDSNDKSVLSTSFQGHPLHGTEVSVPEKYVGLVLEKSKNFDSGEGSDKKVYATNSFDSFVYWNWDKHPTKNDAFIKALDWIEIADVLHAPDLEE